MLKLTQLWEAQLGNTVLKCVLATLFFWTGTLAHGNDDIRLANGVIIKGEVLKYTSEGLQVDTQKGEKTYPWNQLSPATRYRHDPKYRANYELILQGLPPHARTIRPVDAYVVEDSTPTTGGETATEDAKTVENMSLKIFDNLIYDNINPISVQAFPGLDLRAAELATFWGLQYGPASDEIIYLAFDTKGVGDPHDALFVYGPATDAYRDTVAIGGMRKKVGEDRVVDFKRFSLQSQFGLAETTFDIECVFTTRKADALSVTINTTLEHDDIKNSFVLYTEPNDLIRGDGIIRVRGIIDMPVLWVSLDPASSSPRLVGTLKMSRMTFLPKQGMESRVDIKLTGEDGEVVQEETVKLDTDSIHEKYTISLDLDKVRPGERYRTEASIDLGPFLGKAMYRSNITIPKGS